MNWNLLVTNPARKDLLRLPSQEQKRIEHALDASQSDPLVEHRTPTAIWMAQACWQLPNSVRPRLEEHRIVVTAIKRRTSNDVPSRKPSRPVNPEPTPVCTVRTGRFSSQIALCAILMLSIADRSIWSLTLNRDPRSGRGRLLHLQIIAPACRRFQARLVAPQARSHAS